jgi:hypothetical protein
MALEVRFNKAQHMHENRQFRRIAKSLTKQFESEGWNGLLMGNVVSEEYERFRADGILFYNGGILVIDLKDYAGKIEIPRESEFADCSWFNINSSGERIKVKGGNRFINPFKQLSSYRGVFKSLIDNHPVLKIRVNSNNVGILNIFSGPIELNREVGGSFNRFYNLVDENTLPSFLYDFTSSNSYSIDCANALKECFSSEKFILEYQLNNEEETDEKPKIIEGKIKLQVEEFIRSDSDQVLILTSSSFEERDNWAHLIPEIATDNGAPLADVWIHSTRLKSRVAERSGLESYSIYGTIFGGNIEAEEEGTEEELSQETVPIKRNTEYSEKDVFIIHEAHLVSKGFFQSAFLKFGTGRLLDDLLTFLDLEGTKRKLICIGDPYSISYRKVEENALHQDNFDGLNVKTLHSGTIRKNPFEDTVVDLTSSIDDKFFMNLNYPKTDELKIVEGSFIATLLKKWFSQPLQSSPKNSYLLYSLEVRLTLNLWIKNNCLANGNQIAKDDLLIAQNNIRLNDPDKKLLKSTVSNGEYLRVNEVVDVRTESINVKANEPPVLLNFFLLNVTRLGLKTERFEVYVLNNYIDAKEKLSDNEELALKILQQRIINKIKTDQPFETSSFFQDFNKSPEKEVREKEIQELKVRLINGDKVKGKIEEKEISLRKLEKAYKKKYNVFILGRASSDPIINSLIATYGWVITVNRSLGSLFDSIVFDCKYGENKGKNEKYFRHVYSAFQAADHQVYLRNSLEFSTTDVLKEFDFSERSDEILQKETKSKKGELIDLNIPLDFQNQLELGTKGLNIQFASFLILNYLHSCVEKVEVSTSEYTVKFSCQFKKENFAIILDHKKSESISKIRGENTTDSHDYLIERIYEILAENTVKKVEVKQVHEVFIDGFRKLTYAEWTSKLKKVEIDLEILVTDSNGWHDVLKFSDMHNEAILKFYYKKKGFFSQNPKVLYCSNNLLLDKIQKEIF